MVTGALADLEVPTRDRRGRDRDEVRVHVVQTGVNVGNETCFRKGVMGNRSWLVRPRKWFEFPIYVYIVEHPEGRFAIDTGLTGSVDRVTEPRPVRWLFSIPAGSVSRDEEIDAQMRAMGLRPEDVTTVVLTHLDRDHAAGIEHFPHARFLASRAEHHYAHSRGKRRCRPDIWPSWFSAELFDLDSEPYGPFPQSKPLTDAGDVRLVPLPGHTPGQIGVVVETEGPALFFVADHMLREDWFLEDYAAGNLYGLAFFPEPACETSRRIRRFAEERPTVLLPAHDAHAPKRLAAMDTVKF